MKSRVSFDVFAETTTFWKNGVVEAFCHKRVRVISISQPQFFVVTSSADFRSMWRHNFKLLSDFIGRIATSSRHLIEKQCRVRTPLTPLKMSKETRYFILLEKNSWISY